MKQLRVFFDSPKCFFVVLVLCAGLLGMTPMWSSKSSTANGRAIITTVQTPGPRSKKYLGRYQVFANDPLQIDVKIKGLPFELNKTLTTQDENWLDGTSFSVKNISSKTIVSFSLELWFLDTKPAVGHPMAHTLRYGGDPRSDQAAIEERPLGPGEKVTIDVSRTQYASLKSWIERRVPMANINSVQLHIGLVVFDDDTAWATGSFMRRNPITGKWQDIN